MRTHTACLAFVCLIVCHPAFAQWTQTNGPYGGNILALIVVPDSSGSTSLFANAVGGVYRSTDDGETWTLCASDLFLPGPYDVVVSSFAITPNEAGGSNLFAVAGTSYGGLLLSTDRGTTWSRANLSTTVYCLGTDGAHVLVGGPSGIFRSSDGGSTWTQLYQSSNWRNSIYALTSVSKENGEVLLFAGTWATGVLRSTDHGVTWDSVNTGLTDRSIRSFTCIHPAAEGGTTYLFAAAIPYLPGPSLGGVFVSIDDGESWTETGLRGRRVECLAANPNGTGVTSLFAGTDHGVFLSTDNGASWAEANSGLADTSVRCFAVNPASGQTATRSLFAGTVTGGVYRSTNNGTVWQAISTGITNTNVWSLAVSDSYLFAGTLGGGVFRSTDGGTGWVQVNRGLRNLSVYALAVSVSQAGSPTLFAGTYDGVFLTTDNGLTWDSASTGLTTRNIYALAVSPVIGGRGTPYLFAGTTGGGVFRSSDNGASWTGVSTGLSDSVIFSLAASGTTLFAGTFIDGVFLSTNSGSSWTTAGLNSGQVKGLVASGGNLYAAPHGLGVFVTTDGGASWRTMNAGLNDYYDRALTALWASGGSLFAAAHGGLFVTSLHDTIWTKNDAGLRSFSVYSLVDDGTNLYAGTTDGGVWRRPLAELIVPVDLSPVSLPAEYRLQQNYPNPFNPSTIIKYELPKSSGVRLSVLDMLGREVRVLVDERVEAGYHEVRFDASNLASGVYLYRLQAGDFVQTRKLLLLR